MKYFSPVLIFLLFINTLSGQPLFSHRHGFYNAPFNLAITPLATGSSIMYTTDGSEPGPGNGASYTTPLYIDTITVLRAAEIKDGKAGKIATATFLFSGDIVLQPNDPEGYPSTWGPYTAISGTAIADYEMDPELMAVAGSADSVKAGLMDLPVMS
ncbi:MAG: chitobiase/beta-hexosaminidase C-terminal domain-containing protein, partial [Bacteroidales bacterium]|nr:chitobiase/beta-hexosaminidase C-terminal domain-containing protein [Bacteroidales bacterium]